MYNHVYSALTLLHSEQLKLYEVLAVLSAIGLRQNTCLQKGQNDSDRRQFYLYQQSKKSASVFWDESRFFWLF